MSRWDAGNRGGTAHSPADARQRREPAQPHPGRAREGFRLPPVEACQQLFTGRRDPRRARRRVARLEGPSAARLALQRRALRPPECRNRHDVRLCDADRARREDARARGGQHRRVGHRVEQGSRRPGPSGRVRRVGYSCIAEQRTVETLVAGKPTTPFMRFGDRIRIEMHDAAGRSIFGAIDQQVRRGP